MTKQFTDMKFSKLNAWQQYVAEDLAKAKEVIEIERAMRRELIGLFFPEPQEGTQYVDLGEGWKLKLVYPIDRTIDPAAIGPISKELQSIGVQVNLLIDWKPSLVTKEYRTLPDNVKLVLAQAMSSKPGSPAIELCPPKLTRRKVFG